MIRHPNNSGLQMDQVTRLYVPAYFVRELRVWQGDDLVLSMDGGISISEDPTISADPAANLKRVLDHIQSARRAAIAPATEVQLIAVSKGHGAEHILPVLDAGHRLGVDPGWLVVVYDLGEASANLLQPFWMLPTLAILGLKARDVMGYTFAMFLVCFPVAIVTVTLLAPHVG